MRIEVRRIWIALAVLLPILGFGGYKLGRHLWAQHHWRAAQDAIERRDFRQAGEHLQKCLSVSPDNSEYLLLAAETARRDGDYSGAQEMLKRLRTAGAPKSKIVLQERLLRLQQGDMSEAEGFLAYCLEHAESHDTPLILETVLETSLKALSPAYFSGDTTEGQKAAEFVAQLREGTELWLRRRQSDADQVQGLVWRGRLRAFANEKVQAQADLRAALERDPDHVDARFYLAAFIAQDTPREAVSHLEALRSRHPDNLRVGFTLAVLRRTLGELDEARAILQELLSAQPGSVPLLLERARVALDADDAADAETWARLALQRTPEDPEVHLTLSRCLQQLRKDQEAERHKERYRQLREARKRS